jgi:hypothetical protein
MLYSAVIGYHDYASSSSSSSFSSSMGAMDHYRRRLSMVGDSIPKYMEGLMKDLKERKKLFDETPPEEVKYWFEYTGPLQVRFVL